MASNPGFKQLCPHCQTPLLLRDPSWIGKLVECPKCRQRFIVDDPAKKPAAEDQARIDKEALIKKDKEAVRSQEQARREGLIQKDREAVRGKPAAAPSGDGNAATTAQPPAKTDPGPAKVRPAAQAVTATPPARDKSRLAMEPLFAGGSVPEGKGGRGGRRKTAKGEDGGVNLNIIITPMLDMAFQLLAFFVMTYHPSALEGHIDGSLLPPSKIAIQGNQAPDPNAAPVDVPPDDKDKIVVIVKSVKRGQTEGKRREGEPSQILIKRPEDANPEVVADWDQDLDSGLKKLKERLKGLQTKGAKGNINIEADSDLKHQYFMQIYDACKAANFENVGFVAPSDVPDSKK